MGGVLLVTRADLNMVRCVPSQKNVGSDASHAGCVMMERRMLVCAGIKLDGLSGQEVLFQESKSESLVTLHGQLKVLHRSWMANGFISLGPCAMLDCS